MATYKQIQEWVKGKYNFVPKTCWIAHVKEICRLPVKRAHNRMGEERKNPCPPNKVDQIQDCFRHFGMIK